MVHYIESLHRNLSFLLISFQIFNRMLVHFVVPVYVVMIVNFMLLVDSFWIVHYLSTYSIIKLILLYVAYISYLLI